VTESNNNNNTDPKAIFEAKWLGIKQSKEPLDGLQNLLNAGFLFSYSILF